MGLIDVAVAVDVSYANGFRNISPVAHSRVITSSSREREQQELEAVGKRNESQNGVDAKTSLN